MNNEKQAIEEHTNIFIGPQQMFSPKVMTRFFLTYYLLSVLLFCTLTLTVYETEKTLWQPRFCEGADFDFTNCTSFLGR